MKRLTGVLGWGALAAMSTAQNPNVLIKLDATFQLRHEQGGRSKVYAYDLFGRHSTVTLEFAIEPGFDMTISQRFQTIEGDGDTEPFDEYFIEDRGYWKFGKQYVEIGGGNVLRETIIGASLSTTVGGEAIPLQLTGARGKPRRQRGLIARLGTRLGITGAAGRHIGIGGTALTLIRRPEETPGKGRGHKYAYAVDYGSGWSGLYWEIEHVGLREPHLAADGNLDITDIAVSWRPTSDQGATLGVTHEWTRQDTFIRLRGAVKVHQGVYLEPVFRLRNGEVWDYGLSVRIKP